MSGNITLISLMVWLTLSQAASAGAWTRAQGSTFTAQSTMFFTTELTSEAEPPFRKLSASTYIEYGLFDRVTIGGKLSYAKRADGAEESMTSAFARVGLWQGVSGDVLSAEISGGYPVLNALSPDLPARDVTPDLQISLAYGRGLTWVDSGWAEAALSFRRRFRTPADEIKLDLTLGYRPADRIVALAQVFGTLGLRNEGPFGADYDALKVSLSGGYRITDTRTLLLVVAQDVLSRNFDPGTEIGFTIWNEF